MATRKRPNPNRKPLEEVDVEAFEEDAVVEEDDEQDLEDKLLADAEIDDNDDDDEEDIKVAEKRNKVSDDELDELENDDDDDDEPVVPFDLGFAPFIISEKPEWTLAEVVGQADDGETLYFYMPPVVEDEDDDEEFEPRGARWYKLQPVNIGEVPNS